MKQQEQLATPDVNVTSLFDFCFAENGLTAYRLGQELASQSFIEWIGEDTYKALVRWFVTPSKEGIRAGDKGSGDVEWFSLWNFTDSTS